MTSVEGRIQDFITKLKRRQIEGSYNVGKETAEILRLYISKSRFLSINELMLGIKDIGKLINSAQPIEFVVGNIVRRVLYFIRDECLHLTEKDQTRIPHLLGSSSSQEELFKKPIDNTRALKNSILASIKDLIDELQNIYRDIAERAIEHIHANEVIMTFGSSRTVEEFLKSAARKRRFEVIVAESAPSFRGQDLAMKLSKSGIETTLITDSAIFAMMARVNKVIVSTHSVMANGGLIALTGTHMVALAAKHHSVPFVVCTGLYKLCPVYPYSQETINDLRSPSVVLNFEETETTESVHVHNPTYDYIPPELVSLYITNLGGHNPSYIYRLLAEYYHPEDTYL